MFLMMTSAEFSYVSFRFLSAPFIPHHFGSLCYTVRLFSSFCVGGFMSFRQMASTANGVSGIGPLAESCINDHADKTW